LVHDVETGHHIGICFGMSEGQCVSHDADREGLV
jgi:hypothetical protein